MFSSSSFLIPKPFPQDFELFPSVLLPRTEIFDHSTTNYSSINLVKAIDSYAPDSELALLKWYGPVIT